jgi:hypothetical protein
VIQIHITIWETEDGDQRFKVTTLGGDGELLDVTDQYEVAATLEEDTDRTGFTVLKKEKSEPRHCGIAYHHNPCPCEGAGGSR